MMPGFVLMLVPSNDVVEEPAQKGLLTKEKNYPVIGQLHIQSAPHGLSAQAAIINDQGRLQFVSAEQATFKLLKAVDKPASVPPPPRAEKTEKTSGAAEPEPDKKKE